MVGLIFLHKLDSKWISNNLIPWMKYDIKFKSFTRELYIDSKKNEKRNIDSMRFVKQFWKRQTLKNNHRQLLSMELLVNNIELILSVI